MRHMRQNNYPLLLKFLIPIICLITGVIAQPTRIMPIGNSITEGDGGDATYRYFLWHLLIDNGYDVDFVGTKYGTKDGPSPYDFDQDHQGTWGIRSDEVLTQIGDWARATNPDMALIHLGTNDIGYDNDIHGETAETCAHKTSLELMNIIDTLRSVNSDIVVFLAQIIPAYFDDWVRVLNDSIGFYGNAKSIARSPVIIVDQYNALEYIVAPDGDYKDGLHPNLNGQEKMANTWFAAVESYHTINPRIIPMGGAFVDSVTVTCSTSAQNASLYYTLDGSVPTTDDSLYQAPFYLEGDTSLELAVRTFLDDGSDTSLTTMASFVVTPDLTPPGILSVSALNVHEVLVEFSEEITRPSGEDISNYEIDNFVSVSGAVMQDDSQSVILTTGSLIPDVSYSLTVNDIRDRSIAGNVITPNSQASFILESATAGTFIEENGICVMEAEHYTELNQRADEVVWVESTLVSGYEGDGYMVVPNNTAPDNSSWDNACEVAYDVQISTPGTYSIAVRMLALNGYDNSARVGGNGTVINEKTFWEGSSNWIWFNDGQTLGDLSAGIHRINIRRREDGWKFDRLAIALDQADLPGHRSLEGGPAESQQISNSEPAPQIDFALSRRHGRVPLTVSFSVSNSGGTVDSWLWDFGDGQTSTGMNPVHTYAATDTYSVSLIAQGPGGTDQEIKTDLIVCDTLWRIMPLGDSNTRGKYGYTYRAIIRQRIHDTLGIAMDFVGTDTTVGGSHGPGPNIGTSYTEDQMIEHGYDLEHEGWGGYTINDIRNNIDTWFAASPPDIIMLMIGTNDINASISMSTMVNSLDLLVDEILARPVFTPATHLFLATVPPCQNDGLNAEAVELNSYIPGIVSDRQALGHSVHFVDAYNAMDRVTDLADNLQPDSAGYAKIGMAFYGAMLPVVTGGNQAPELAAIGNKTLSEGVSAHFSVSATDPDNDAVQLSTGALPSGAYFFDNGDGTGDFYWTPDYTQSGSYPITFYASDASSSDSEQITITVGNVPGNNVSIGEISSEATVFLYGTSGWIGAQKLDQGGTIPDVSPGYHMLVVSQPGKRTEYIPLFISGNDTTLSLALKDLVDLSFAEKETLTTGGVPLSVGEYCSAVFEDIDRDGDLDLLSALKSGVVRYYLNDGADLLFYTDIDLAIANVQCIRTADWNNDNRPDILSGDRAGSIRVHYNYGPLLFSPGELIFEVGAELTGFDITDIHADNVPDFICGYANGEIKTVVYNGLSWESPANLLLHGGGIITASDSVSPMVMELTGDIYPDMVVISETDTAVWYEQLPDGACIFRGPVNSAGQALTLAGRGAASWIYGAPGEFPSLVLTENSGTVCRIPPLLRGDIDKDGIVGAADLSILGDAWGATPDTWNQAQKECNLDLKYNAVNKQVIDIMDLRILGDCWEHAR
ncbi:MAG: PKD domain-containing protein [Chitinivibrionales bacterium]|nr:PKD domain-containing protein [Chitinivibrionales bacterium]